MPNLISYDKNPVLHVDVNIQSKIQNQAGFELLQW